MSFAVIGPGKLGSILFQAAAGPRLVIGRSPEHLEPFRAQAELGVSTRLEDASQCQVTAVAVPAGACEQVFQELCPHLPPEHIVLNFSTNWDIPQTLVQQFPQLHLLNAKLVGSAIGISHGLKGLAVTNAARDNILARMRACLPGLELMAGDPARVRDINTRATRAALSAAVELEKELDAQNIPAPLIQAAAGCLMPGVLIAYQNGQLGGFAQKIVDELR